MRRVLIPKHNTHLASPSSQPTSEWVREIKVPAIRFRPEDSREAISSLRWLIPHTYLIDGVRSRRCKRKSMMKVKAAVMKRKKEERRAEGKEMRRTSSEHSSFVCPSFTPQQRTSFFSLCCKYHKRRSKLDGFEFSSSSTSSSSLHTSHHNPHIFCVFIFLFLWMQPTTTSVCTSLRLTNILSPLVSSSPHHHRRRRRRLRLLITLKIFYISSACWNLWCLLYSECCSCCC